LCIFNILLFIIQFHFNTISCDQSFALDCLQRHSMFCFPKIKTHSPDLWSILSTHNCNHLLLLCCSSWTHVTRMLRGGVRSSSSMRRSRVSCSSSSVSAPRRVRLHSICYKHCSLVSCYISCVFSFSKEILFSGSCLPSKALWQLECVFL